LMIWFENALIKDIERIFTFLMFRGAVPIHGFFA
jgi:hypothetical protein